MLAVSDETSTTATAVTPTPEPSATPEVTPTPSAEPTPEVTETPAVELSESDQIFVDWARPLLAAENVTMSDDEMLGYLDAACTAMSDGEDFPYIVPPEIDNAQGDVNLVFTGGARNGYGPGITGAAGSYCD